MIIINFIEQIAPYIQKYAPQYGIKVCSPIIAQAILESASGTSELAKNAHNYFGLKYRAGRCPSACGIYYKNGSEQNKDGSYTSSAMQWMKFPNMDAGVKGYFDFINISNYSNLKGVTVPKTYLENIKKDKYATSISYVQNNMNIINKYNLTKYDIENEVVKPMGLNIKTNLANKSNYGSSRSTSSIKYLVIHYTANDGDTDEANGKYFANKVVKSSAHYFVDDDSVTQSVPDNYVAYHCGANKYYHSYCRNANSIGIEMCDTKKNGKHDVTEKTLVNTLELAKIIMKKYNIPIGNVLRHYDVTHKICPAYFVSDEGAWLNFKNRLTSSSGTSTPLSPSAPSDMNTLYRVRKSWNDSASQIGAYSSLENAKTACKSGYYVFDSKGNVVYPKNDSANNSRPSTAYNHTSFVRDIQKAIGAKVDGIAGSETLTKTITVSKTKNNKHAVVKPIQKYLNSIGFNCGTADGVAGSKFDSAVKAFQKANGCVVDGEITSKKSTWKKLLKLS